MTVQEAAKKLLAGKLVVFPTETVYGLAALASNEQAVKRVFEIKGRPAENPLILHIADNNQLDELVEEIPERAQKLMDHFWPGPLTICFKKSNSVSDLVSAGLPTVCVRRPDHKIAQSFLKLVGQAVAAPSANLSGKPSTTSFEDAKQQLKEKDITFLDGGKASLGLESTIVDCSGNGIVLLRPGSISKEELEHVLNKEVVESRGNKQITSPGQLFKHYAPEGDLKVIFGSREQRHQWLTSQRYGEKNDLAFGLVGEGKTLDLPGEKFLLSEAEDDLEAYAQQLYLFLNNCDRLGKKEIILELPFANHPLMDSLLNRLEKASNNQIIDLSSQGNSVS